MHHRTLVSLTDRQGGAGAVLRRPLAGPVMLGRHRIVGQHARQRAAGTGKRWVTTGRTGFFNKETSGL